MSVLRRSLRGLYYALPVKWRVSAKRAMWLVAGRTAPPRRSSAPVEMSAGLPGLVSVVLPVHNGARWLAPALRSILGQMYAKIELIVVDDGSSDESLSVARSVCRGDARAHVFHQPHSGLGAALSAGHRRARGAYSTWTSADNLMGVRSLEMLVRGLEARTDAILAYSDYRVIDAHGQPVCAGSFRGGERDRADPSIVRVPRSDRGLAMGDNFIGCSFLYRTWAQRMVGDWSDELGVEDYDFWLRMAELGPLIYVPTDASPYQYRVHGQSLSARAAELRIRQKVDGMLARQRQASRGPGIEVVRVRGLEEVETTWRKIEEGAGPIGALYVSGDREWHAALPPTVRGDAVVGVRPSAMTTDRIRCRQGTDRAMAVPKSDGRLRVGMACERAKSAGGLERFAESLGRAMVAHGSVEDASEAGAALDIVLNHNEPYVGTTPFIEVLHNSYAWLKPWQRRRFDERVGRACAVAAVSPEVAAYAVRQLGVEAEAITVIPNGIDVGRLAARPDRARARQVLGLPEEAWIWLQVGAIFPPKGQLAMARVLPNRANDEYVVVAGPVVDGAYWQSVARTGGPRVLHQEFTEDIATMYAAANALVHVSVVEGWSLAVAEALYCGLPVVATGVGAAGRLVGNTGAGVVIPPPVPVLELTPDIFDSVCLKHDRAIQRSLDAALDEVRGSATADAVAVAAALVERRHSMKVVADGYWDLIERLVG